MPSVGRVVSKVWPDADFHGVQVNLRNPYLPDKVKAAVFWNLYESAEARLIRRWLPTDRPVVELGASLGIISRLILSRMTQPFICVEANPSLIPAIRYNLKSFAKHPYSIIQKAIHYSGQPVSFIWKEGENLTGKIATQGGELVESTSLAAILKDNNLDSITLVMDIEGAEIEIIMEDQDALQKCDWIFAELHACEYQGQPFSVEQVSRSILERGFQLTARDGNCFAYQRKKS